MRSADGVIVIPLYFFKDHNRLVREILSRVPDGIAVDLSDDVMERIVWERVMGDTNIALDPAIMNRYLERFTGDTPEHSLFGPQSQLSGDGGLAEEEQEPSPRARSRGH